MAVHEHDQRLIAQALNNWRLTPATYMHKISRGQWIPAKWLEYASVRVASAIARGKGRIIISAPPRHGKTELISVGTSSWVLENFPNKNIILAAYGADLAEGSGRRVRDIIRDNKDILKVHLKDNVGTPGAFLTDHNGYMFSVGLGGAITGRGAHVLLIDDFIKEIKEALSPAHRDYIWNWYVTTARTRLEPGATIIIIATRWHSDDLIGRLLRHEPGKWENIVFPGIAEGDDIIGRRKGDALFPERYTIDDLKELQETMGSTFFEAIYQQHPVDEARKISDGNWLKVEIQLPPHELLNARQIRVWDLAATQDGGDFTTGSRCAFNRLTNRFWVLNVKRQQLSPERVEELVRQTAVEDGVDVVVGIEQEPGSAGKSLVSHYERNVLPEFTVVAIPTSGANSKLIRAQPLLAGAEGGRVHILHGAWNKEFVQEFDLFPAAPYDDQVDTTAAGYTHLTGRKNYTASWGRKSPNDRETTKAIKGANATLRTRDRASWGRR